MQILAEFPPYSLRADICKHTIHVNSGNNNTIHVNLKIISFNSLNASVDLFTISTYLTLYNSYLFRRLNKRYLTGVIYTETIEKVRLERYRWLKLILFQV